MRLGTALDTVTGSFTPADQGAWASVIAKFRAALSQFDAANADLQSRTSVPAELQGEYAALRQRAALMGPALQGIRIAVDDVQAALSGAWSSVTSAWQSIANTVSSVIPGASNPPVQVTTPNDAPDQSSMPGYYYGSEAASSGLGFAILIPIAAVIGATALLVAFVADYAKFAKRADLYGTLVAQGKTPEQAGAVVASVGGGGGFLETLAKATGTSAGAVAAIAAAAGLVWLFYQAKQHRGAAHE